MMERTAAKSAALADELRNVMRRAEELVDALADDRDEALTALRDNVASAMTTARERLADLEVHAQRIKQRAAITANAYVRENPWTAVSFGAALGLLLGAWLAPGGGGNPGEA